MSSDIARRRVAVVGLGARARLFTQALAGPYADRFELAGFCDVNSHRMAVHNGWLADAAPGRAPVPAYAAEDFDVLLRRERIGLVVVCSVDRTHDDYIVRALEAGCDVVTEKPMTTDADRARRILDAVRRTGREVRVAFNYRYNPVHSAVRELLAAGEIGEVGSVHFEWLLDLRHGADYFPALAPRQGRLRWPHGPQGHPPLRPGQLVARLPASDRLRAGRPLLLRRRGRPAPENSPGTTPAPTAPPQPGTTPSPYIWRTRRCSARCTWTRRRRTATTATRTCSAPA
ncbi:oxidoreductase, NAD-binding domain protein [Streptomyces turgidiscabies Car8]|uniref:Oxidoreductase, NAD-binding domain protein n=1 Tax=Streptomyces turgidiscabies (strain Car8) TaxID=698760 RepID=L7F897_STRT8|nr:oxidoreductase, NAD-binding domain protein [Streptomyces turgidiscabies Car8]